MEIKLKSADVAAIVNSDERIQQAVITLYLQKNAPKLTIEDLTTPQQAPTAQNIEDISANHIALQDGDLNVGIGQDAVFDISLSGQANAEVKSADERIVTATLSDGKLHLHGVSAASTTLTIIKGDQKVDRRVVVA